MPVPAARIKRWKSLIAHPRMGLVDNPFEVFISFHVFLNGSRFPTAVGCWGPPRPRRLRFCQSHPPRYILFLLLIERILDHGCFGDNRESKILQKWAGNWVWATPTILPPLQENTVLAKHIGECECHCPLFRPDLPSNNET